MTYSYFNGNKQPDEDIQMTPSPDGATLLRAGGGRKAAGGRISSTGGKSGLLRAGRWVTPRRRNSVYGKWHRNRTADGRQDTGKGENVR